ncbi:MAG: anti-sigma factor antagonist [Aggregatilineales bacterium]
MDEEHRLTVAGVLDEVVRVCAFVVEAAEAAGLDERAVYHCQMAADEWCTNVIQHGFGKRAGGPGRIEIDLRIEPGKLLITISDDGPHFDPMMLTEPRIDQSADDREPGGLGWFLIKKLMDEVQYDYVDGHNLLRMSKWITPNVASARPNLVTFPSYELRGNIWVISPRGRLDANGGALLETTLGTQFSANHINLIVDMAEVTYISSGGLKVLLGAFKKARARNGGLALAAVTPRVQEVFHISGFDALFQIADTVQAAAAKFPPPVTV